VRQGTRLFWVGLMTPFVLILVVVALFVALVRYNRAYNDAFSRCDALSIAVDPARSEFQEKWLPPRFECVLYNENGMEIRRERV
jgi:hypothetical protein